MGRMRVLTKAGDISVTWDPEDAESVKQAKAEYDRLKKDGYEFYEVEKKKGKRVKRWSKTMGELIATPGVASKAERKSGEAGSRMAGGPNAEFLR